MSMITELFGMEVLLKPKEEVIQLILNLPPAQQERGYYLMHDWAAATGAQLTENDFSMVERDYKGV